jgi:hypothetical protein
MPDRKPTRPWQERKDEVLAREAAAESRRLGRLDRLTTEAHAHPDETARPRPGWRLVGVRGRPRRQIWEGRFGKRRAVVFGNPGCLWLVIIRQDGQEYEAAGTTLGIAMGVGEFYGTGRLLDAMEPAGNA